jgi:hypothetical protein
MSKISLAPDASGSGIFTIASPNSNTNRTLTLPDDTGTIVTNSGNQAGSFTTLNTSGAVVFNDAGADVDFRVEGDTDANLLFVDAGNDRVGIGVATPQNKFQIDDGGVSATGVLRLNNPANAGDNFGVQLLFSNVGSGPTYHSMASITAIRTNTAANYNSDLLFATQASSGASLTERARITSAGFFKAKGNETNYINTTGSHHEFISGTGDNIIWARSTAASPYGYYVDFTNDPNNAANYVFGADSGGNLVYRIFSNGTTSARSDAKWKKNIETARDGYIDDLARLRVVKYNWHNHEDGTPKEMGLIAQEVEEVFPGLVQEDEEKRDEVRTREIPAVLDEDGNEVEPARTEEYTEQVGTGEYTKSIKFSVFTPMLIKAVQELKAITDTQAQTISALEARIAALETGA